MKKKQYNFRNLFLAGLSVILLFSSSELLCEPTNTTIEINQVWEERYLLDFAQTTINIDDTSKVLIFDKMCAVAVMPDTSWLRKRQSEVPEDNWMEMVWDIEYYQSKAWDTLEKHDIPIYGARREEKRHIKFIKADSTYFMIDLTKMLDAWGTILFNGTDNPIFWNGTDVDRELREYYRRF